MGKYMRKGKGAGKVALMEVSQGALGVRTRAKTLALVEYDRKLALAKSATSKQQRDIVVDPFHTTYLELRSRKLEKVVKEIPKPVRGHPSREDDLNEDLKNCSKMENIMAVDEIVCTARPAGEALVLQAEVDGSSRTPELSPRHVDGFRIFKESALSPPRASLDGAQLRCSQFAAGEEPLRSGNAPPERSSEGSHACMGMPGGIFPVDDGVLQDGVNNGRPEVDASCEYVAGELGLLSARRRFFRGSPVSSSPKEKEPVLDLDPCSVSRTGFPVDGQDRRMANHHRMMNRRYMRANLFNDAKAIDELFATPDNTEKEEGKRFTERYNYDVVTDKPLKGRYEWVPAVEACSTTTPTTQPLTEKQQPIRS